MKKVSVILPFHFLALHSVLCIVSCQRRGLKRILKTGVPQAEKRLKEESERVHAYLDKVSEEKLLKECEQQLLANHQTALLDKEETGCRALLREGKLEGKIAHFMYA